MVRCQINNPLEKSAIAAQRGVVPSVAAEAEELLNKGFVFGSFGFQVVAAFFFLGLGNKTFRPAA